MKTQLNKKDLKKMGLNKNIIEISKNMKKNNNLSFAQSAKIKMHIIKGLRIALKNNAFVIFHFIGVDDVIEGKPFKIALFCQSVDIFVKNEYGINIEVNIPIENINFISFKNGDIR